LSTGICISRLSSVGSYGCNSFNRSIRSPPSCLSKGFPQGLRAAQGVVPRARLSAFAAMQQNKKPVDFSFYFLQIRHGLSNSCRADNSSARSSNVPRYPDYQPYSAFFTVMIRHLKGLEP
jgi:hypothetical protein